MLIVKALQMERQVRRLEARQRAHPAAHLLVEPMIQGRAGIHEDHPLQPLTVVKGIGGLLTQGYLGCHGGKGRRRQQGIAR